MSEDKADYPATNQESGSYFVQIKTDFFLDPGYSSDAKVLYAILLGYQGQKEVSWPGQDTLCKAMNIKSDHTLRKAMKELTDGGILTVKRRGQQMSNIYEVKKSVLSINNENPEPQNMHISIEPEPQNMRLCSANNALPEPHILPPNYIHEKDIHLKIKDKEGASPPPKKEKAVKAVKEKEPEHEAITAYREESKQVSLKNTDKADIIAKITDITLWRDTVRRWCKQYNPRSVQSMIEVYEHGGKFFYERNDRTGSNGGPGQNRPGTKSQRAYIVDGQDYGGYANPELAAKYMPLFEREGSD